MAKKGRSYAVVVFDLVLLSGEVEPNFRWIQREMVCVKPSLATCNRKTYRPIS